MQLRIMPTASLSFFFKAQITVAIIPSTFMRLKKQYVLLQVKLQALHSECVFNKIKHDKYIQVSDSLKVLSRVRVMETIVLTCYIMGR